MTAITLAVVDLAGTTARDNGVVEEAVGVAVDTVAGQRPADLAATFQASRGSSKIDMLEGILGDHTAALRAHEVFERYLLHRIDEGAVEALPGADQALGTLRRHGVAVALTTGFSASVRDRLLARLGWHDLVDLALSPEDAGRGRPFPDMIWTAALRTTAESAASIAVVGDTVNDLVAGTRAGAGVVAGVLTGAHRRERLASAPHTHILDTIADFAAVVTSRRA